jgi:hypothetical protein
MNFKVYHLVNKTIYSATNQFKPGDKVYLQKNWRDSDHCDLYSIDGEICIRDIKYDDRLIPTAEQIPPEEPKTSSDVYTPGPEQFG